MQKVTREEATKLSCLQMEDELTEEIRSRFEIMEDTGPEFWHGVLSGLVMSMMLYQKSSLPAAAKDLTIVEMTAEAARKFLGQEIRPILQ